MLAAVLETAIRRRPEAAILKARWTSNLALTLFDLVNANIVSFIAVFVAAWWAARVGVGLLADSQLGFWPMLLLAILVFEFVAYWFHRALHAIPLLWRIHAVHHSDTELDFTTTYRNHPLELFINAPLAIPVILLMGFPPAVVIAYQLLKMSISVIAHGNIRLPEGLDRVLRRAIVTPDYHRLHHCSDRAYTDSNFSAAFPIYDYLFGTAKTRPYADHPHMQLGLEYFRQPRETSVARLLLMPFVWRSRAPSQDEKPAHDEMPAKEEKLLSARPEGA